MSPHNQLHRTESCKVLLATASPLFYFHVCYVPMLQTTAWLISLLAVANAGETIKPTTTPSSNCQQAVCLSKVLPLPILTIYSVPNSPQSSDLRSTIHLTIISSSGMQSSRRFTHPVALNRAMPPMWPNC
jgi:hypothetical protein